MKPYDKSNSFIHRVTKRVSGLIPGTAWMNSFLSETQSNDDPISLSENNDQPPVKKLCTSNNTFTANSNYRSSLDTKPSINSTDDLRNFHVNVVSPEISAVTCVPSTSKQSPKFTSLSNSSLQGYDVGNKSSLKRKSEVGEITNINQQIPKTIAFNFASSTPTLVTTNNLTGASTSLKRSFNSDKFSSNEFSTPTSTKLIKTRENESQSLLKFRETTKPLSTASFRWDTFVNYGELSERQKLFAQKSPLNCSHVMYGGNSARSTLSKILGNTPPIHRKTVIPISPTNTEIRTTSSILLENISTKDKEIEENKFIIEPKVHLRHKADQKSVPLKVETTIKHVETTPEKANDKSRDVSSICSGRDSSRKLRANISKKARGLMPEEHEMPTKVDLPNISLTMPILPNIKLSNNGIEDNEFKFNQPLTIEQFSLQIAEKTCRKKQKTNIKKTQITNTGLNSNDHSNSLAQNSSYNVSTFDTFKNETEKDSMLKNKILETNDKVLDTCKLDQNSKDTSTKKSIDSSDSILESKNKVNDSSQLSVSNENNSSLPQKLTVAHKKWTCDTCWVSNDSEKVSCIACQTPKPGCSQIPLKVSKSSTWTCENCWVPNKNEIDACVACQSQKPGTTKKVIEESSTWTCDACWVKNKNECISCISCGTAKPGCVIENKPQISTQFKFGLNNNSEKFGESGGTQFKFGFDGGKIGQTSSQFKFGSTAFKSSENGKFESSVPEFKFGVNNIKTDQSLGTFKFGTDSVIGQSNKALNYEKNTTTDQPNDSKFKFSFENKSDQPENQFEFSNTSTSKPIAQFKFGLNNMESDKSVQQSLTSDSKDAQSTNELKCVVNNKNEFKEIQNKSIPFRFGDPKKVENSTPQVTLESNEINCNSNALVDIGHKNEVKTNLLWDKKDKIESKPLNFGIPQTLQSTVENSSTTQMVNGHSHSNETSNEDQKPSLIKTSQLFSFSSLGKQDQHLFDGQKNPATFTFGSATTDNKSFIAPISTTSSFSSTAPVFGASNSIFSSGPSTSIPATLGSSVAAPQFSFGSIAPSSSNSFFSKPVKDNDNKLLASNSFTATTNLGFSFGSQSTPVFNVPNSGGLVKSSVLADDSVKSTPNIFNQSQSNTKQAIKLDPNAPLSINFTGGATTQFTAKPETKEPPTKRKILKPVRRIR